MINSVAELLFTFGTGSATRSEAFFYTTELEALLPGGALYATLDEELALGALMSAPRAPISVAAADSNASSSSDGATGERVTWRGLTSTSDRDELAAATCDCGRVPCVCLRAGLQGVASAYTSEPHWSSRSTLTSKRSSTRSSTSDLT